ncbi:hypothetical protein KOR42_37410 [Thalassoglobus neptunius]|uniref:Uncharacterized protein n=1 Tax=Thalassoglobus neptunius TaxID=1938619 RepID=A0A5C5WIR9_9PLAN|nr:hypothetical protein [Thalassoglobus neptunius]TWT49923.1 hypothetical protein KOR42_37410 [Thalassoglobus neptunius]
MIHPVQRFNLSALALVCALVSGSVLAVSTVGCNALTWNGTHHGIRYSIHRDLRNHSIVKGKDGSLMYDSPELVVLSENGKLMINGVESGEVSEGDLVKITDLGTVLVNGQRRGDKLTGHAELQKRLKQGQAVIETHTQAELDYINDHG